MLHKFRIYYYSCKKFKGQNMDFNFHKIANDVAKVPDSKIENMPWEERLKELLKFRQYFRTYHDSYDDLYIEFLESVEKEEDLEKKEDLIYFFKKETLTKDINLDGLNFLFVNLMIKYKFEHMDYNDTINDLKDEYDLVFKHNWLNLLSKEDLNLFESVCLLNYIQRSDYWDYEHMPLSYAIFDSTVDNILKGMEDNLDDENLELLEIFISN